MFVELIYSNVDVLTHVKLSLHFIYLHTE